MKSRKRFKESLPEKSEFAKTIIAFANDAGGEIYLGIKDNPREIVGVPDEEIFELEEKISNIIFNKCSSVIIPEISSLNIEGKIVLRIKIYRGNHLPYYLKEKGKLKGTIIRVGSSNRIANEEIIAELERQKRNISFDAEILHDIKLKDIDISSLKKFFKDKVRENLNENALKKLHLYKEFHNDKLITNALLLLSDDDKMSEYFPYAKIECAKFKGTSLEFFID